jgi:hypothetical protein
MAFLDVRDRIGNVSEKGREQTYPTRLRTPVSLTCRKYIPEIPTSPKMHIAAVRRCVTVHAVDVTCWTFSSGWINCTSMYSSPARTADKPATRPSFEVVIAIPETPPSLGPWLGKRCATGEPLTKQDRST